MNTTPLNSLNSSNSNSFSNSSNSNSSNSSSSSSRDLLGKSGKMKFHFLSLPQITPKKNDTILTINPAHIDNPKIKERLAKIKNKGSTSTHSLSSSTTSSEESQSPLPYANIESNSLKGDINNNNFINNSKSQIENTGSNSLKIKDDNNNNNNKKNLGDTSKKSDVKNKSPLSIDYLNFGKSKTAINLIGNPKLKTTNNDITIERIVKEKLEFENTYSFEGDILIDQICRPILIKKDNFQLFLGSIAVRIHPDVMEKLRYPTISNPMIRVNVYPFKYLPFFLENFLAHSVLNINDHSSDIYIKGVMRKEKREDEGIVSFSKSTGAYHWFVHSEDLQIIADSENYIVIFENTYLCLRFLSKKEWGTSKSINLECEYKKTYFAYGLLYVDLGDLLLTLDVKNGTIISISTFVYLVDHKKKEVELKSFIVSSNEEFVNFSLQRLWEKREECLRGKEFIPAIIEDLKILDGRIIIVETVYQRKFEQVYMSSIMNISKKDFFNVEISEKVNEIKIIANKDNGNNNSQTGMQAIKIGNIWYKRKDIEKAEQKNFNLTGNPVKLIGKLVKINDISPTENPIFESNEKIFPILSFFNGVDLIGSIANTEILRPFTTNGECLLVKSREKNILINIIKKNELFELEKIILDLEGEPYIYNDFLLLVKKENSNPPRVTIDIIDLTRLELLHSLSFDGQEIRLVPSSANNSHKEFICCYVFPNTGKDKKSDDEKKSESEKYFPELYFLLNLKTGGVFYFEKENNLRFPWVEQFDGMGVPKARVGITEANQMVFFDYPHFYGMTYLLQVNQDYKRTLVEILFRTFKVSQEGLKTIKGF